MAKKDKSLIAGPPTQADQANQAPPRPILRNEKGQLVKGAGSLNPTGRPVNVIKGLTEYCRLITGDGHAAIWNLWTIAQDPKQKGSDRIAATKEVMDRMIGKAVDIQVLLAMNGDGNPRDTLANVATGALEQLLEKLTGATAAATEPGAVVESTAVPTDSQSAGSTDKPE